jgi:hypothetical protein
MTKDLPSLYSVISEMEKIFLNNKESFFSLLMEVFLLDTKNVQEHFRPNILLKAFDNNYYRQDTQEKDKQELIKILIKSKRFTLRNIIYANNNSAGYSTNLIPESTLIELAEFLTDDDFYHIIQTQNISLDFLLSYIDRYDADVFYENSNPFLKEEWITKVLQAKKLIE